MSWLSYSQNGEDVRLHRAFLGQSSGFYIDVGANDPVEYSITKHFYEIGWTGINVDPAPVPYSLIVKDRKRDINLNVGCSNQRGSMTLYAARKATGLSTFTAEEVAIHEKNGFEFDSVTVPVTTLANICEEHAKDRAIDFLSIDVEGHEREVLEGADFRRFRPRVVVIEATRPNTTEPTHERWEGLVLEHDYLFAVFDGLNRYYVRREDERLVPILALAPNIFDEYAPYIYQRRIDALEAELLGYRAVNAVVRSVAGAVRGVGKVARWVVPGRRA
jgi:FkbM family methyltransferase